jgi:hypothetical protein
MVAQAGAQVVWEAVCVTRWGEWPAEVDGTSALVCAGQSGFLVVGMYNRGTTGVVHAASGMYGAAVSPPNGAATEDIQVMLHVMPQAACLSEAWAVQYHGCA